MKMATPQDSGFTSTIDPAQQNIWQTIGRYFRWGLVVLIAVWVGAEAGFFSDKALVNSGGWARFSAFWSAAVQPELSLRFLQLTAESAFVTLAYSVLAITLTSIIGAILALFISEVWWDSFGQRFRWLHRSIWFGLRGILAIPRGIHELIWGLFFINIFGLDPIVAILAIAIPYGAIVAKVFAEMLDEVPREPFLALLNSGVSPFKAIIYGLLPTALPDLISYIFYRFECGIRAAAVLGIVGAGGIGYQILLSLQTLNYNEMWTLFYALMLLSGGADWWSRQIRQRLGRPNVACTGVNKEEIMAEQTAIANDRFLRCSFATALILIPLSLWFVAPRFELIWAERTRILLSDIAEQAWPLNLGWEQWNELWDLSLLTLAMSILAALLAAIIGSAFSFPAARTFFERGGILYVQSTGQIGHTVAVSIQIIVRTFLLMLRAIPAPIWALMLLFILFPGLLPGAVALALYNGGVLGRLMAEVAENQDKRPAMAIRSSGAPGTSIFLYGILPSVSSRYSAYSLYRWEEAIRETVIVGIVGAGGLGRLMSQGLAAFNYRLVLAVLICIVLLTFFVDMVSARQRQFIR